MVDRWLCPLMALLGVHGPEPSQGTVWLSCGPGLLHFITGLKKYWLIVHDSSRWSRFHLFFLSRPLGNKTERGKKKFKWTHIMVSCLHTDETDWLNCCCNLIQLCYHQAQNIKCSTAIMRRTCRLLCKFKETKNRDLIHKKYKNTHTAYTDTHRDLEVNITPYALWKAPHNQRCILKISSFFCAQRVVLFWTLGMKHVLHKCHLNSSSREPDWIIWGDQSRRFSTAARDTEVQKGTEQASILFTWFVHQVSWLKIY